MACAFTAVSTMIYASKSDAEQERIIAQFMNHVPIQLRRHIFFTIRVASPMSKYYIMFTCAVESFEVIIQLGSLISSAPSTDAALVVMHALIIAVNIMMVPSLLWISLRRKGCLLPALMLKIAIDHMYLVLSLFSDPPREVLGHLGFLVPPLVVTVTIRDFDGVIKQTGKSALSLHRYWERAMVAYMAIGVSLMVYASITFHIQQAQCTSILGDVARCARPRHYWRNGFLQRTECSLGGIVEIKCDDASDIANTKAYSKMTALTSVNISGSRRISQFPRHIYLARKLSTVDLSGTGVCSIPWLGNPSRVIVDDCADQAMWANVGLNNLDHEWVKTMTQLVSIDLSLNALKRIPSVDLPLLTFMDLSKGPNAKTLA
eukprot:g4853.t1